MHHTPLYDELKKANGKIVDFNGWALPVQFSGIVKEHLHTREVASLFDCSHMGEYRVIGQEAIALFNNEVITDVTRIPLGRCRYGALLNEDGGIVDDLITFRMSEEELYVVTNAGPLEHVTERLCKNNPGMENVSFETAKIDVQGPVARDLLLRAGFKDAETLPYFKAIWTTWEGNTILLSRTGYTGELGYELFMDNDVAPAIWNLFLDMDECEPAGLGARDTLRTEVGYGLSGQDFNAAVTPLESAMESFIDWDSDFVGRSALETQRDEGSHSVLVGIQTDSRRAPRHDFTVTNDGSEIGIVTSGTFGPSVGHGVGLARIPKSLAAPGTSLQAGPKGLEIQVAPIPFYKNGTCRVKI